MTYNEINSCNIHKSERKIKKNCMFFIDTTAPQFGE